MPVEAGINALVADQPDNQAVQTSAAGRQARQSFDKRRQSPLLERLQLDR